MELQGIKGLGIDVASIERVEKLNDNTIEKILTPAEREYCEKSAKKHERVAGRFSAKEAILKALGTGWAEGIQWHDLEILPNEKGAPQVVLSGRALEVLGSLGADSVMISISHDAGIATAIALIQ